MTRYQPTHHTIVAIDVAESGMLDDRLQLRMRADLRSVIFGTLSLQSLDRAAADITDRGDGIRLIFPAAVSPCALLDPFVPDLAAALREYRATGPGLVRLRLRVAVHAGLLHRDESGWAGEPLVHTARLLDADPVRSALRLATDADLVLVVSQTMHDSVIRHGYGLDRATYQPISVREKETDTTAWLHVPTGPAPLRRAFAGAAIAPVAGTGPFRHPAGPFRHPGGRSALTGAGQRPVPPVERAREMDTLRSAVASLAAGTGGLAWVEGEPGSGKTTMLAGVLSGAAAHRCQVFRAIGDELTQRLPLAGLVDALGGVTDDAIELLRCDTGAGLATSAPDSVSAAVERLLVVVKQLCATAPVVLAFDDLQWADEVSLSVWQRLSALADQVPLLLVSACRPVPARPTLVRLRQSFADRGASVVSLKALDNGQVAAIVHRLVGAAPGPRLRHTVEQAGGNPLYVRELVEALLRERRVRVEAGAAELVGPTDQEPQGLSAAVRSRLGFLSPAATSMLRTAALLGPVFSVFDLVTATAADASALLPALDEALAAGVVHESGDGLEFRHRLIRDALHTATPASARSAMHRQVAKALSDAGLPIDRIAVHLMSAPDAVDGWAVDRLAESANELADRAPDLAAELLARVARRLTDDDPRRGSLLRGQARALLHLMRLNDAEAVARHALACATDPALAAEMAWTLASIMLRGGRFADALPVLDKALNQPDLPALWRARLHAWRAKILPAVGRHAEADAEARRALAEGERLADRLTIAHALQTRYLLADYATGLDHVDQALAVTGDSHELSGLRIALLGNRAENLEALGRHLEAEKSLQEALTLADRAGAPWRSAAHIEIGRFYVLCGRWDEARAELEPLTGNVGFVERLVRLGCLAFLAAHRGERTTAESLLRTAAIQPEPMAGVRGNATLLWMAQAVVAEQRDGAQAAAAVLAHTVPIDEGRDLYDRSLWLPELVRLAHAAGNPDLAAAATAAAEADAATDPLPRRVAAARHARGILDGDAVTLRAVAEEYRTAGLTLQHAQAHEETAVLLAEAGNLTGAGAAHAAAVRAYHYLGARWDIQRADARLRPYCPTALPERRPPATR